MPGPRNRHLFDLVANDVASFVESMSDELAETMQDGRRAPFAVTLDRAQQEQYYIDKYGEFIYDAQGEPNLQGRDALLKAFGPDAFAEIVRVVLRDRARQGVQAEAERLAYPIVGEPTIPPAGLPGPEAPPHVPNPEFSPPPPMSVPAPAPGGYG